MGGIYWELDGISSRFEDWKDELDAYSDALDQYADGEAADETLNAYLSDTLPAEKQAAYREFQRLLELEKDLKNSIHHDFTSEHMPGWPEDHKQEVLDRIQSLKDAYHEREAQYDTLQDRTASVIGPYIEPDADPPDVVPDWDTADARQPDRRGTSIPVRDGSTGTSARAQYRQRNTSYTEQILAALRDPQVQKNLILTGSATVIGAYVLDKLDPDD